MSIDNTGQPQHLESERLVLGSILLDDTRMSEVDRLRPDDFSLYKHRLIFECMVDMHQQSRPIDRVTLAYELTNRNQLVGCDGLTYLVSLDEGLPRLINFASYVRNVLELSARRNLVRGAHTAIDQVTRGGQNAAEVAKTFTDGLLGCVTSTDKHELENACKIFDRIGLLSGDASAISGVTTRFPKLDELTGGFRGGELIVIAARPSMGKSAIALDIAQDAAVKQNLAVGFRTIGARVDRFTALKLWSGVDGL